MIKAIIFDLGGVILNWDATLMHKYGEFFSINKARLSGEMGREMDKLQKGELTTLEFWHKVCWIRIHPTEDV